MVKWCNIVTEFTEKEELFNICSSKSKRFSHELSSIALILPDGEVNNSLTVKANIFNTALCIVIERTLLVFDCKLKQVILCKSFESDVDGYCMIRNDSVLAVALRNGYFNCFLVGKDQKVFERKVEDQHSETLPTFMGLHAESDCSLILVGRKGKIFRIPISQIDTSNESFNNFDEDIECEPLWDLRKEVFCSCLSRSLDGSSVLMLGSSDYLYLKADLLNLKTVFKVNLEGKYTKIQSTKSARFTVCLNEEKLMFYCSLTLICLKVFDEAKVLDFTLVEGIEDEDLVFASLLDKDGQNLMQLFAVSDFSCKLQFKANYPFIVDSPFLKDNLIFLDGAVTSDNKSEFTDSLTVKCVEETNPENRLAQLLRKQLFEEAERFAIDYGLDFQAIYKAQSLHCMETMQHCDSFSEYSYLVSLLDKIQDIEFVINLGLNFAVTDLSALKSLLLYCVEKLQEKDDKEDVKINRLIDDVSKRLLLLDTFTMLWQPADNESWASFSQESILESFCKSLFKGEWLEAWVLWKRHWDQCIQELGSVDNAVIILEKLPPGVFPQDLLTIIEAFVHRVILHFPDGLAAISNWAITKIQCLETLKSWPKDALIFGERMVSCLSHSDKFGDHNITLTNQFTTDQLKFNCDSLHSLYSVIESLKDILYFDSEFQVKIRLSDYNQENKECLVNILLWKVSLKYYDKLIREFLMKYLSLHKLCLDHLARETIENMISCSSSYLSTENDVRLEKAIALTEYIKDTEVKGKCILLIMNSSPMPWNTTLSSLVTYGVSLNHPVAETIKLQLSLMNVKSVLKKYNLEKCHVIHDFQLIISNILQSEKSEMVEDCLSVALSEAKKEEVYTRCIKHYFQKREFEKAFKMLELLPKKSFLAILQRIVHGIHAESLINDLDDSGMNYVNILKMIELRFENLLIELGQSLYILKEIPLKELTGLYYLRKYFNLQLQLDDAAIDSPAIDNILSKLIENNDEKPSEIDFLVQVKKLSQIFSWSVEEILFHMLTKNVTNGVLFIILRQLTVSLTEDFEGDFDFLSWILSSILDQSLNDQFAQVLLRILCKSISICNPRDLPIVLELCRFIRIWLCAREAANVRVRKLSSDKIHRFLPLSHDIVRARLSQGQVLAPPIELLPGTEMLESQRQLWCDLVCNMNSSGSLCHPGRSKFSSVSKSFGELHQDSYPWLAFQVDSLIAWSSTLQCKSENSKSASIKSLLRRVESSKEFDLIMMIGLIFCFENPLNWINSSISRFTADSRCMQFYVALSMALCNLCDISESVQYYDDIYLRCLVDKRLRELGISVRDTECSQMQKDVLLKKIIGYKKITATDLEEFCFLCHLDIKTVFLKYLQHLLLSWVPDYTIKMLDNGQYECVVINSADHILRTFKYVRPRIKEDELDLFLHEVWNKVNFYYYEIYEVILEIMMSLNSTPQFVMEQKDMIRFLSSYQRKSLPSSAELDAFGNMRNLPEISRWRLPLLTACSQNMERTLTTLTAPSSFAGSILSAEVDFKNYSKWLEAPPIDGFNSNSICVLAIKHGVNSHLKEYKNSVEWQLYPSEEEFLQNVEVCTMQIENVMFATATVKYIIGKLPPGVDQLTAAKMCLSLAEKWVQTGENVEKAKNALEKIEMKYFSLSVMQILYQNGLGQNKYKELIDYPGELISNLYYNATDLRSSIAERKGYGVNCAAELIANLFSIDLVKLKLKLISKWLFPKEEFAVLNDSFIGGELFASERDLYSLANDEDMRRLIHICKSIDKNLVINHLISIAFPYGEDNDSLSTIVKLRVMLCMYAVDHDSAAEQTALRGITHLGAHIMKLFLLIPLERIGVIHSLAEFDSFETFCLAKNILQKDPLKQANVALTAKFCLAMRIFHHPLWEDILKKMIQSSMYQVLIEILPLLRLHNSFIAVQTYRTAWKNALEAPFVKANIPMTSEEEQTCMNSLKVLPICPFLTEVDLDGIAGSCLKRSKKAMAASLLPFLSSSAKRKLRKQILSGATANDMTVQLQSLSQNLHICISKILKILKE